MTTSLRAGGHRNSVRALLAVLVATALLPAAGARAGQYTVYSCRTPDGRPAPVKGWRFVTSAPAVDHYGNACPSGGGMVVQLAPGVVHGRDDGATLDFAPPAGTQVVRYRVWSFAQLSDNTKYYFRRTELTGATLVGIGKSCEGATGHCTHVGDPAHPLSDANLLTRTPPQPLDAFGFALSCGYHGPTAPDCPAASPIAGQVTVSRADVVLSDPIPPVLPVAPSGGLLDELATLSGVQGVSLLATDGGGGVAGAALEVDGKVAARRMLGDPATCRQPYTATVPCAPAASGTLALDTEALADGAHQVRLLVTDAAGNETAWGPVTIHTGNLGAACALRPRISGGPEVLRTWLTALPKRGGKAGAQAARTRLLLRRGAGATLHGRLTMRDGAPVAGATVCVATRPAGAGGAPTPRLRVSTDADGRVTVPIRPGPSREIWAVHRVAGAAVAAKAIVEARSRVTLAPERRQLVPGQLLVMRGRVRTGSIPGAGVLVAIQAGRGRTWQTFAELRTRRSGRFTARYRFHGQPGRHVYALRAFVPHQAGYPFLPAVSAVHRVEVGG